VVLVVVEMELFRQQVGQHHQIQVLVVVVLVLIVLHQQHMLADQADQVS
jgi:hypothetical protein